MWQTCQGGYSVSVKQSQYLHMYTKLPKMLISTEKYIYILPKMNIKYLPPRSVLCVVVVTMSAYSNGEGMTCAATRPEMWAMSASNTAFTSSQICNITANTTSLPVPDHCTYPAFASRSDSHTQFLCRVMYSHKNKTRNVRSTCKVTL